MQGGRGDYKMHKVQQREGIPLLIAVNLLLFYIMRNKQVYNQPQKPTHACNIPVSGQFVADNSSRAIRRGQFIAGQFVADNSSQNMIPMLLEIFNAS